jgi:hypothetical protein
MACAEVQRLRLFTNAAYRADLIDRLARRYASGRRTAADVVDGLRALAAQNRHAELQLLFVDALYAVYPVPLVLWRWAAENASSLGFEALCGMIRVAADSEPHLRRLRREDLVAAPDGLVALLHERDTLPDWGPSIEELEWLLDRCVNAHHAQHGASRSDAASRSGPDASSNRSTTAAPP